MEHKETNSSDGNNLKVFFRGLFEMKEPRAIFGQCSSHFSLIGKWLRIDLHFRKPPSDAPITRAVKNTKTHLVPLRFDGVQIPITGTFPMLITFHITFSPSEEPHAGRQCPVTGQRGV